MRDHLDRVVSDVADIRSVTTTSRSGTEGVTLIVNEWLAEPQLPAAITAMLPEKLFRWTDRATWLDALNECNWSIETAFSAERVRCAGVTKYEPAIGGRGTRIVFRGELDIAGGGMLSGPLRAVAESVVTTIIPRNFNALANALGSSLGRSG
jgi:hypothetical protein